MTREKRARMRQAQREIKKELRKTEANARRQGERSTREELDNEAGKT